MAFLDQILNLPHVFLWLPAAVFMAVVGGAFWLTRPSAHFADSSAKDAKIESITSEKSADQRFAYRRQGNPVEVFVAQIDGKKDPSIGSVLDRSLGGMRLVLFSEVPVGTMLAIRPTTCDDIVPWVDVEIRSCRPSEEIPGQFEVGCAYVKSPPYSIQLLFG